MVTYALSENRFEAAFGRFVHADLGSAAVGATLLATLVFVNESNVREGDPNQYTVGFQNLGRELMCGLCGLYGLLNLPRTSRTLLSFPGAWALLFCLWGAFTVPFAIDKTYSAAACLSLFCVILFVPALLLKVSGRRIVVLLAVTLTVYMIVGWGMYVFVPPLGRTAYILPDLDVTYRMGGLNHANSTGRLCALAIGCLLVLGCARLAGWRRLSIPLVFLAFTLYCTDSRTGIVAGGAVLALMSFRYLSVKVLAGAAIALLAALATATLMQVTPDSLLASISRTGDSNELYELTGRLDVWRYVMERIIESPIVGQGYACSRFAMAQYNDMMGSDVIAGFHAHNTLLNIALGSGVLGGALLVMMLVSQAFKFLTQPSMFPDMVLVLIATAGIADAAVFSPVPDAFTMTWLIALFWRQSGASLRPDAQPMLETARS